MVRSRSTRRIDLFACITSRINKVTISIKIYAIETAFLGFSNFLQRRS